VWENRIFVAITNDLQDELKSGSRPEAQVGLAQGIHAIKYLSLDIKGTCLIVQIDSS